MKGHPVGSRLLVRPHEAVREVNGIVIPDRSLERPVTGEILEIGDDVFDVLRPGRTVIFRDKGGTDLTYDDEPRFLLDVTEVLGWLE